jgi:uncharacterized repeat protein (TIGR01451 family)
MHHTRTSRPRTETFVRGHGRRCLVALLTCLLLPAVSQAAAPDFGAVTWRPLGCAAPDLVSPASPAEASFAGDQANLPAYYAYDADYLYFRYRMDANPASGGGFAQYAWTALMQVPSGDPYQYQYQLSLNGKNDRIEIWQNTAPLDVKFPHFHDDSESELSSVPVGSFARTVAAGTSFNGSPDWFIDFAFPVTTLVGKGVIASAGDLARSLFFPATSTNPNNYNKSFLNCPFQPVAPLQFSKTVVPTVALPNVVTPVVYTIDVQNPGATAATGVVVEDVPFPAFLGNVAVQVTTDDPDAAFTVVSTNPLRVESPTLGAGRRLTVVITADAAPACGSADFVNTASGYATNTLELQASATVGSDVCDGVDNDCDGQVDEGTSLCDDGNACTADACGGAAGCSHQPIPGCVPCDTAADCDDGDSCTTDACSAGACTHGADPACVAACTVAADCDDGNPCTTETCAGGVCGHEAAAGCTTCSTAAECDDADPCTVDVCGASGSCQLTAVGGCRACASAADCDDGNACTSDACTAGVCRSQVIDGCSGDGPGNGAGGGACAGGACGQAGRGGEVCGDCEDNDGDGLVDYEDPDCCEQVDPLTLGRMAMRTRPRASDDALRLRSRALAASPAALDPVRGGVTLQVSDGAGRLYCHDLAMVTSRRARKRGVFRFTDRKGTRADGLQRVRLKIRKDGTVVFRAAGKKLDLRTPADGGVQVTLRIGGQCMQTTAVLRTRPAKLGTRNTYP